jgi:glycine cleavage system H protein
MANQYQIPEGLLYTKEHEWAKQMDAVAGSVVIRVGITDYAAKTLNDVVYLSLPPVGQEIKQLTSFGTVESIKAVSELYSPLSGTVTSVNSSLSDHPELVNTSPYEDGWVVELKPSDFEEERTRLLSPGQYAEFLASLRK